MPYYATSTNTAGMFNISSAPEPFLANATFPLMAGSIAGGGSAVNGMVCGRASAADYDAWEQLGNQGWGWNGLLPYFKKVSVAPSLASVTLLILSREPPLVFLRLKKPRSLATRGTPPTTEMVLCKSATRTSNIRTCTPSSTVSRSSA